MRKKLKFEQKAAIFIIILFIVIALAFSSGKLLINVTDSVPLGLWLRAGSEISRGDFVEIEFKYFSSINWLPDSYPPKSYAGKVMPFIKYAAGLPGDLIDMDSNSGLITVNNVIIPNSAPISQDRAGNMLRAFSLPVRVQSDEVWLMSDAERGFDSRYLGPAKLEKCTKLIPLVIF